MNGVIKTLVAVAALCVIAATGYYFLSEYRGAEAARAAAAAAHSARMDKARRSAAENRSTRCAEARAHRDHLVEARALVDRPDLERVETAIATACEPAAADEGPQDLESLLSDQAKSLLELMTARLQNCMASTRVLIRARSAWGPASPHFRTIMAGQKVDCAKANKPRG